MNCRYRLRVHNLANASEAMYENAIKIFTSVGRERQYATLL